MAKEEEYKIVELLEHNPGYKVWCVGMRNEHAVGKMAGAVWWTLSQ